ncbi:hypothetical protein ACFX43_07250 [Nocardioides sp. YIM B13467]|uniref:hypothetical protein n=1 Tax=Nocardioides sp. YIM B13467 TaxID=3366294 RepID=UPI003673083F
MSRTPHADGPAAERDPLAPLSTLVDLIFALMVAFALFAGVITTLHLLGKAENASIFEFSKDICVGSDNFIAGSDEDPQKALYVEPDARMFSSGTTFCRRNPSFALQFAASIEGSSALFCSSAHASSPAGPSEPPDSKASSRHDPPGSCVRSAGS